MRLFPELDETFGVGQHCCVDKGHVLLKDHSAFATFQSSNLTYSCPVLALMVLPADDFSRTKTTASHLTLQTWSQSVSVVKPHQVKFFQATISAESPDRLAIRLNIVGLFSPSRSVNDNVMSNIRSFCHCFLPILSSFIAQSV
jgi:hypothetical protein